MRISWAINEFSIKFKIQNTVELNKSIKIYFHFWTIVSSHFKKKEKFQIHFVGQQYHDNENRKPCRKNNKKLQRNNPYEHRHKKTQQVKASCTFKKKKKSCLIHFIPGKEVGFTNEKMKYYNSIDSQTKNRSHIIITGKSFDNIQKKTFSNKSIKELKLIKSIYDTSIVNIILNGD